MDLVICRRWTNRGGNNGNTGEGPLPAITGLNRNLAEATSTDNLNELMQRGKVQQLSVSSLMVPQKARFIFQVVTAMKKA